MVVVMGIFMENETKYIDGSLDVLFLKLRLRMAMFWHPRMSGCLMEPIGDDEDFQGAVRNVQKLPNGLFSKETAVFIYSFKVI